MNPITAKLTADEDRRLRQFEALSTPRLRALLRRWAARMGRRTEEAVRVDRRVRHMRNLSLPRRRALDVNRA